MGSCSLTIICNVNIEMMYFIKGRIVPSESLFWYAENDSPSNYRDESFTPSFGPEFYNKTVQENAERACTVNGNIDKTCLYDYAMTGNEELAKNSLDTQKTNSETAAVLGVCVDQL